MNFGLRNSNVGFGEKKRRTPKFEFRNPNFSFIDSPNAVRLEECDDTFATVPDAGLCLPNFISLYDGPIGQPNRNRSISRFGDAAGGNRI